MDSNGNNCAGITIKNNYGLGETNEANAQYCRLCFPGYSEVPNTNYVFWALDQAEGEECVNCPAQAPLSPEGSSSVDACYAGCDAGQTLIDAVCVDCGPGTYQPNSAYTGDCIFCPDNSFSQWASDAATDCTCNAGYTGPNGGTCTACAFGTYKDVIGPVDCTSCAANSYSQTASDAETDCTCNRGFSGPNGGPCVQCEAITTGTL